MVAFYIVSSIFAVFCIAVIVTAARLEIPLLGAPAPKIPNRDDYWPPDCERDTEIRSQLSNDDKL